MGTHNLTSPCATHPVSPTGIHYLTPATGLSTSGIVETTCTTIASCIREAMAQPDRACLYTHLVVLLPESYKLVRARSVLEGPSASIPLSPFAHILRAIKLEPYPSTLFSLGGGRGRPECAGSLATGSRFDRRRKHRPWSTRAVLVNGRGWSVSW